MAHVLLFRGVDREVVTIALRRTVEEMVADHADLALISDALISDDLQGWPTDVDLSPARPAMAEAGERGPEF